MIRIGSQIDLNQRKSSSAQSKEISSYIILTSLVTNLIPDCYNVSLFIFRSSSPTASFSFYTLFSSHLYSPHAGQMVGVDTCFISTFHKSSCSSCKVEMFRHHLHINAARELVAEHLMQLQQLSPKIFQDFPLSYVFAMSIPSNKTSWNVPLDGRPLPLTLALVSQVGIHPRPTLLGHYDQN